MHLKHACLPVPAIAHKYFVRLCSAYPSRLQSIIAWPSFHRCKRPRWLINVPALWYPRTRASRRIRTAIPALRRPSTAVVRWRQVRDCRNTPLVNLTTMHPFTEAIFSIFYKRKLDYPCPASLDRFPSNGLVATHYQAKDVREGEGAMVFRAYRLLSFHNVLVRIYSLPLGTIKL